MKKILFVTFLFLTFISYAQQAYYNNVDLTKSDLELKEELATKTIAAHTNILSYGWDALKATDVNPQNSSEVLLIYGYSASGTTARTRGINENGGGSNDWNREHTYAKSLGNPNLGTSGPGADAHHLRPSDVGFNSQRGNYKFVEGSGNAGNTSGGWYPGDEWKGDVARMMMYMYIRYGNQCKPSGVGIGNNANANDDMIDLFLKWNVEDPVSDFERQRNTYHDSNETYAQGNRNPFIDNAYLATRIWGGDAAIDSWGLYVTADDEAPTVPTNIALSNITTTTIDVSWTASTDNEAVTKYEVFVNGNLNGNTSATNYSITNLTPNTAYNITVLAKDIANNQSAQSSAVSGTTLADTVAPSIPTNITITNQAGTSFKVNWAASTDNSGVASYDIFVNDIFNGNSTSTSYTVTDLTISTTYSITLLAKDAANNSSAKSTSVNGATTDGTSDVSELFFSEYIEGSGYNKALEIVNLTSNNIDLSHYTIKRQSGGTWESPLQLVGTILVNDVYVIINSQSTNQDILREQDLAVANVTPMTFNGDDRIGLFKNDVLIDIIGDLDGTDEFALDVTLRRNSDTKGPTTDYNEQRDWSYYAVNTTNDIGNFNGALSVSNNNFLGTFKMYPNPTNGNFVNIETVSDTEVIIYNALGKVVQTTRITSNKNNIDISNLSKGIYFVKLAIDKKLITQKLIRN
ncbi:endonuclease [Polaribacter vadi]|uniref:endonuclease n=1 Tax=Polaribacter vadi TaxID=1774273 RepID=UPI0030EC574E|tara:strand:+ start:4830 stop:6899 length:2070 start_codon:yes stop_codon:yes gene_type:complete